MTRVERQVIKRSHPLWGVIDDMCFKAKNLYNYANYILRDEAPDEVTRKKFEKLMMEMR